MRNKEKAREGSKEPVVDLPIELLGTKQLAKRLGMSRKFIEALRSKGNGPKFYRVGDGACGVCKYDPRDVLEWLNKRQGIHEQ